MGGGGWGIVGGGRVFSVHHEERLFQRLSHQPENGQRRAILPVYRSLSFATRIKKKKKKTKKKEKEKKKKITHTLLGRGRVSSDAVVRGAHQKKPEKNSGYGRASGFVFNSFS